MSLLQHLNNASQLFIRQRRELTELVGFETRNKYSIETPEGGQVGYAAEQQKGLLGFFMRQFLGHWRSFEIFFFDSDRQIALHGKHPFRFLWQRLELETPEGKPLGYIEWRFSILEKHFAICDPTGGVLMTMRSPFWKIWTFPIVRHGEEIAMIKKRWGGLLKEGFLDADTFQIEFTARQVRPEEKQLILAAGVYIDLLYFERKAR